MATGKHPQWATSDLEQVKLSCLPTPPNLVQRDWVSVKLHSSLPVAVLSPQKGALAEHYGHDRIEASALNLPTSEIAKPPGIPKRFLPVGSRLATLRLRQRSLQERNL